MKKIIIACSVFLLFTLQTLAQTRKEILDSCSQISRHLVKEKYFSTNEVNLIEMATWLSAEEPTKNIYKFTSYAKLRKSNLELYSWSFSVFTQFKDQQCQVLSEKFEQETKLIEDDGDENQDDNDLR